MEDLLQTLGGLFKLTEIVCIGPKTTQLSESCNAFLRGFLQPDHSLVRFFSHFNIVVQRMRDNHAEFDFKAANTRTKNNYPNSQLMRSVVIKYTPACFAFIHRQYDLSFKYYYEEDTTKGSALNNFEDHGRLDERVVTVDIRSKSFSCSCRQYVLKHWTRDVRPSVDKLKSTINVGNEDSTQASKIFLHGVLEAGKKAEELLLSKGIRTDPSSVMPSKSSKAAAVGEPSAGVKSAAPKFK
ncbi:hypothetical protein MTR_0337s0060 [Medicago truncatula]|uniref:Protein FAR1-RELATED SEQUENCE n=1 Tax=Medicago truncatula TaxID=3880 RepID=A0A072TEU6_MEDTR|nr:hypothetical protein MTR_0337s0060 [Medicago truncatula]